MAYTYQDYWRWGVLIPVAAAVVLLIVAACLTWLLRKRQKGIFTQALPVLALLGIYLAMICAMYDTLPYLEYLPREKEEPAVYDQICIESVETASSLPLFYSKSRGDLRAASWITSNRGTFLAIDAENLRPGQYLEITYLPYSHGLLTWESVSAQQAESYWQTHPFSPPVPPDTGYRETGHEGPILFGMILAITIKEVAVDFLSTPLMGYLWKRDLPGLRRVKPRLFGLLNRLYTETAFLLGGVYALVSKSDLVAFTCFVLLLAYGYSLLETLTTRVTFKPDAVHFRSLTTHLTVKREDILHLRWEDRRKVHGKTLTVVLADRRVLGLSVVDFVGLKAFIQWYDPENAAAFPDP